MDTKREVDTSIKGKESQRERGSPGRKKKSYQMEKGKDIMLLGLSPRT